MYCYCDCTTYAFFIKSVDLYICPGDALAVIYNASSQKVLFTMKAKTGLGNNVWFSF